MNVELLHYTPLEIAMRAIRTCWNSFDKSDNMGPKDKELIDRVGNKFKHSSTLEHIVYTFYITGISRAVLQELARHRIASYSVKSTRYTLKELKNEEPFLPTGDDIDKILNNGEMLEETEFYRRASKYIVMTGNDLIDKFSIDALENLRQALVKGISSDIAKYCLPECYKTELTWTINMRSLQNFLHLRTNKSALWEIRQLAYKIYEVLPDDHKYMYEDIIYREKEKDSEEE